MSEQYGLIFLFILNSFKDNFNTLFVSLHRALYYNRII